MIDDHKLNDIIEFAKLKVDLGLKIFTDKFPAEQSTNYVYTTSAPSWTEGFWTGILWLMYELTGDEKYKKTAEGQVKLFRERLDNKIGLDHHDIGFLYTPSCVADYKITGDIFAKETALDAAKWLTRRYKPNGKFIQAWGPMDSPQSNRLIIDCLMNIPLLFWASDHSKDEKYKEIALNHLNTTMNVIVRDDYTTYHTYYFDYETGAPTYGATHQGRSDNSCWARGQAWGVYGFALAYSYTKDAKIIPLWKGVTDCFISKLPQNYIPFWDMDFTDGDEQPRDTSAAAIALCGILEMNKYIPNEHYMDVAHKIFDSLITCYTTKNMEFSNGILSDAMYNRNEGHRPESNIWGDYYFLEAVMRYKNSSWNRYW